MYRGVLRQTERTAGSVPDGRATLDRDDSKLTRRRFVATAAVGAAGAMARPAHAMESLEPEQQSRESFNLWAMACSHIGSDLREGNRRSLAESIQHSEFGGDEGGPPFDWDIALHLGDLAGSQGFPDEEEGREAARQLHSAQKHTREQIYNIAGNHDASSTDTPQPRWVPKWVDPMGVYPEFSGVETSERPYPPEGTWERYSFRVGNLLFLMMSDRNDQERPIGRGPVVEGRIGGYPAGAVTRETFEWWKQMVEANADSIIVTCHHHMLRETTVASGSWEGFRRNVDGSWASYYHGYFPEGGPEGASFLYFVDGVPNAQAFERYLSDHPNAIDLWMGGHTHTHADDRHGGRSHIERKWDVNFINVAGLTLHHGTRPKYPMSRLLTFTPGNDRVRVRCYMHTSHHAPQGWYEDAEREIRLSRPFVI